MVFLESRLKWQGLELLEQKTLKSEKDRNCTQIYFTYNFFFDPICFCLDDCTKTHLLFSCPYPSNFVCLLL